jgi:hypothetical protein
MAMGSFHVVEKTFRDYADDIEGVNIHYLVTPLDEVPDWAGQRATRFMPLSADRVRRKSLKLPITLDSHGTPTGRYLLHYYFEVIQGGERHYSPLFTEEIVTAACNAANMASSVTESAGRPKLRMNSS